MEILLSLFSFIVELLKLTVLWVYVMLEKIYRFFIPRSLKSMEGEIILLTGAGNGIGKQMARELSNIGAKALILWDIESKANEETARELRSQNTKTQIYAHTIDITKKDEVSRTAEKIRSEIGDVTVVFNNAGLVPVKTFLETKPEVLTKTFDVNLFAHFWIIREFLPKMIETNHGHIVTTASIVSFLPPPYAAVYGASKHAVYAFIETLKQELRDLPEPTDNVRFTSIYPVLVSTRILNGVELKSRWDFARQTIITVEYVAQKAVEGFRQNYEHLYLPPISQVLALLVTILPNQIQDYIVYDVLKMGVEISKNHVIHGLDKKLNESQGFLRLNNNNNYAEKL